MRILELPVIHADFDEGLLDGGQLPVDGGLVVSQEGIRSLELLSDMADLLDDLGGGFVEFLSLLFR